MIPTSDIQFLLPGKYKPFHDGHFYMINEYLYKYPLCNFLIIVSGIPIDGLSPLTSKRLIDVLFKDDTNVRTVISDGMSPVRYAFIEANTGKGHYALGGTAIPENIYRAKLFTQGINPGGKYAAPGVYATMEFCGYNYNMNEGYKENINRYIQSYHMNRYGNVPVSATDLRECIRRGDYKTFRKSYKMIISLYGEIIVKNYFDTLKKEIR